MFPTFDKYSSVTKHDMWKKFKALSPNIQNKKFFIDSFNRGKVGFNPMPPKFMGQFMLIDSSKVDYFEIDGITDFYTEIQRMQSKKFYREKTPQELWNNMHVNLTGLSSIEIKAYRDKIYQQKYEVTLFRPSWAKGVLQILCDQVKSNLRSLMNEDISVLDISAGWGDRLLAAIALGLNYNGFDPNKELSTGHTDIINDFGDHNKHNIRYEPFETAIQTTKNHIIFSSPPFYKLEEYSNDSNQSIKKYPEFKLWLNEFLIKSLRNAWDTLLPGGVMAIHLCDYRDKTNEYNLIQPVLNQVILFENSNWLGVIGLTGERGKIWPVWCWTKH